MATSNRFARYLTALKGFVTIMRDPTQLGAVFELADGVREGALPRLLAARLRARSPEIDRLFGERYLPEVADLDRLSALPEGSLGRALADGLKGAGYQVVFYPVHEVKDDSSYLIRRLQQTHDIWHVITGFATDPAGELGLQAFMLAQGVSPLPLLLITAGLIGTVGKPEERRRLLAEVRRGLHMGRVSKPLLAQRWEDHWERPVSAWRAAVALDPAVAN
jgi:ubiquinone biosynthesis protein Coq4